MGGSISENGNQTAKYSNLAFRGEGEMQTTENAAKIGFWFYCIDVRHLLPKGWKEEIMDLAKNSSSSKTIKPKSVTSREHSSDLEIPVRNVGGAKIRLSVPWLAGLYENDFRVIAQSICSEEVSCAVDHRYGVNLNIQNGTGMRYECHVDSNPIEGLLYVTDQPPGRGGCLIVGSQKEAVGIEAVERDAIKIYPRSGTLVMFDARQHTHYVDHLTSDDDTRISVAMNFYTPSCSEATRPSDLNKHLGIE